MSIKIPRSLVEFILLGPEDDRRQLQDSPILGDVWVEFAKKPGERLELLITPYKEHAAASVARELRNAVQAGLDKFNKNKGPDEKPKEDMSAIAYLQGIVAASLTFEEVVRFVVPMTAWWSDTRIANAMKGYIDDPDTMQRELQATCDEAVKWLNDESDIAIQDLETRKRYTTLAGLILWATDQPDDPDAGTGSLKLQNQRFVKKIEIPEVVRKLKDVFAAMASQSAKPLVWTVSLNRRASAALTKSVPAVKADAARTLFTVDCSDIVWAIIDSGIDATHYAFRDRTGKDSRVKKTFDFTRIRDIVTLDNLTDSPRREARVSKLLALKPQGSAAVKLKANKLTASDVVKCLQELAEGAEAGHPISWQLVEELVELDPGQSPPATNHGTHVAGILAADKRAAQVMAAAAQRPAGPDVQPSPRTPEQAAPVQPPPQPRPAGLVNVDAPDWADGMCPEIQLYDFRVLAPTLKETEFAIIAALQYIRYINERNSYMTIHGANLSLSIPHDVRNYACGRTPVCNECERLVNSGVVVVAAAGNRGYQNFETTEGQYESYAAFSVTDPGNADGVITVGATHRFWPHTYGVSFFSSRGPTGDGRLKPDLVAPGERIRATLPDNQWGDLDGTSMASPHVSGAAAMLMARYSELVGQPRRIKHVLCQSATDLGREKSFQGHGMLDVLRAFQSI
jgi:serine protease AprX